MSHAVPEAMIADRDRVASELVHDRPDDAGAGENDLGTRRLQADDRAASGGVDAAITVDLSIDLGPIEDRPLDDVGIVRRQPVLDCGEVGHGAAHGHDPVGPRSAVER